MPVSNVARAFNQVNTVHVYALIYRTAKNNNFGKCPGLIGTDFYRACEVSGITNMHAAACEPAKFNRTVCD